MVPTVGNFAPADKQDFRAKAGAELVVQLANWRYVGAAMLAALLTSIFWAVSAISGQRAARFMGSLTANFFRLGIALAILGAIVALGYRDTFHAVTFGWLALSGVVGFGIGDIALYLALARVGSRLTVLITFCLAPVLAAIAEWIWLGDVLPLNQAIAAAAILAGVSLTLKPSSPQSERYGNFAFGLAMAFVAAAGQGFGAVLTRIANAEGEAVGVAVPALSQAFQRVLPGAVMSGVVWLALRGVNRKRRREVGQIGEIGKSGRTWKNLGWLSAAALGGPVIGLIFYQWALLTANSALVLAIVALTPIVIMPLAWWLERDRPQPIAIFGACVAVCGMIAVAWLRR